VIYKLSELLILLSALEFKMKLPLDLLSYASVEVDFLFRKSLPHFGSSLGYFSLAYFLFDEIYDVATLF